MDEGIRTLPEEVPRIVQSGKVDVLLKLLEKHMAILIRSAPASGKTSLLQQLEDRLKQICNVGTLYLQDVYLHKVGENVKDTNSFEEFLQKPLVNRGLNA